MQGIHRDAMIPGPDAHIPACNIPGTDAKHPGADTIIYYTNCMASNKNQT